MALPRRRMPPPPPRHKKLDASRRLQRLVHGEEQEAQEQDKPFDPGVPPTPYARSYHFAVNSGLRSPSSPRGTSPLTEEQGQAAHEAGFEAARRLGERDLDTIFIWVARNDARVPNVTEDDPQFWEWRWWVHSGATDALGKTGDVFDLEARGIGLPGRIVRALGEYAQGDGDARALYVKATELTLATNYEVYKAATELQEQNKTLNSSELDQLVTELLHIAYTEGDDEDDLPPDEPDLALYLNDEEVRALSYIAARYESGQVLLDAYDEESMTIPHAAVIEAFWATEGDGGDLGTVPLAGGTLDKKIRALWDEANAWDSEAAGDED